MSFGQLLDEVERKRGAEVEAAQMPLVRRMFEAGKTADEIVRMLDGVQAEENLDRSKERVLRFEATGSSTVRRL